MSDEQGFFATMDSDGCVQICQGEPVKLEVREGVTFLARDYRHSSLFLGGPLAMRIFPDLFANLKPGECKPMAPLVIRFLDPVEVPA